MQQIAIRNIVFHGYKRLLLQGLSLSYHAQFYILKKFRYIQFCHNKQVLHFFDLQIFIIVKIIILNFEILFLRNIFTSYNIFHYYEHIFNK